MKGAAKVSVSVAVEPKLAFDIFTEDIDRWWQRGPKFRHAGQRRGFVCLEPRLDGRVFESIDDDAGTVVIEVGRIRVWDPPHHLMFSWRNANYADGEFTEVEIEFAANERGTLVTVTHRGLDALRLDHPARHGLADAPFVRMIGMWWGDQVTALRELCAAS